MSRIVIIGNGIAGVTAARFIRKAGDEPITIISAESEHFFSRTALMYIYMGHMTYEHTKPYEDWFWSKNGISLVRGWVNRIDHTTKTLFLDGGRPIEYDKLIIAVGSQPNRFGWPGENLDNVQGLYSLQDLQTMQEATSGIDHATVVGGGLIGIEMAEMLHSRGIPTLFLVRENSYMDYLLPAEESQMINNEIRRHHIDLRLGTELKEIIGSDGSVSSVRTSDGDEVQTGFVGLTAGVSPAIDFLDNSGIETNRGVLINEYFETNVEDVYAVGDCAEFRDPEIGHKKIEQLWYTGRRQGKRLGLNIVGKKTPYDKGIFFNSAKFFTIEYQTYGHIAASADEATGSVLWSDTDSRRLLRINYSRADNTVVGFNAFGVRLRHEQCEAWLHGRAQVEDVVREISRALFDPEFTRKIPGGLQSSSPVST
ncbi:MAG: NAD(P)/FAD-dependent oxidoreductase [Rhodothermales bacterium]|nr:NAD(P)/FAD-dependent oxidoreductase [Rhodothermales bacterium]